MHGGPNPGAPKGNKNARTHGIIGSGTVILLGCDVGEGSAVGVRSVGNRKIANWTVAVGKPARRMCDRCKDLLTMEAEFLGKRHAA